MVQKTTESSNLKRLVTRILGGQPTKCQNVFFWLMILSLASWPIFFFGSIFIFDASYRSTIDAISRWGMVLTIWFYPLYLLPLISLSFRLSKRLRAKLLFYLCPLIPLFIFFSFYSLFSSEYADSKPEGYDPSTFICLDEGFAKDVNHVYYCNEILKEADPKSFRVISEEYSADSRHVWYREHIIEGANAASFAVLKKKMKDYFVEMGYDDHDCYFHGDPLHVADMNSFKLIDESWAVDRYNVYYIGIEAELGKDIVPICDYRSFRRLNRLYAADAKCVYYKNKIVKGADPKTFVVLDGGNEYGQDKNRVYYEDHATNIRNLKTLKHKNMDNNLLCNAFHTDGKIVYNSELMPMPVGTDFATIRRIELARNWYADKNRVYYENRILYKAKPQTFKIFPIYYVSEDYVSNNNLNSCYSFDGNHVYYLDSLMHGVDVASFICGYDFVDSISFAFDKNRYYEGKPNPRLQKLRQGKVKVDSGHY